MLKPFLWEFSTNATRRFSQLTFHSWMSSFVAEKLMIADKQKKNFITTFPLIFRRARLLVFVNSLFSFGSIRFFSLFIAQFALLPEWILCLLCYQTWYTLLENTQQKKPGEGKQKRRNKIKILRMYVSDGRLRFLATQHANIWTWLSKLTVPKIKIESSWATSWWFELLLWFQ